MARLVTVIGLGRALMSVGLCLFVALELLT